MHLHRLLLLITLCVLIFSCSGEDDPREIFLASYTAQEFCMDVGTFDSEIIASSNSDEVVWINFLGEDGTIDDVIAQVTGNTITVEKQSIGTLEASGTGILLSDGSIDFDITVFAGPIAVPCGMDYMPN